MDQPRPRQAGRRQDRLPHHISSIAHHFLPSSEQSATGFCASKLDLVVASPNDTQISSFAAASLLSEFSSLFEECGEEVVSSFSGLGRGLFLYETAVQKWSASAFLDPGFCNKCDDDCESGLFWPPTGADFSWQIGPDPSSGRLDAQQNGLAVNFHHAGLIDEVLLEWHETQVAMGYGQIKIENDGLALVWCIHDDEAKSLTRAHVLGRFLNSLCPTRLEILVFPDHWPAKTGNGLFGRIQNAVGLGKDISRPDKSKLADLAGWLKPECSVNVSLIAFDRDGKPGPDCSASMQSIARRLGHVVKSS